MSETRRVTNSVTGGQKDSKGCQLSAAPAGAMRLLGEVYGHGAQKYARHNFRKGYNWSLSYDAMLRHVYASIGGEDIDPESGLPHMAHAAWHAITLTQFLLDKQETGDPACLDDRYPIQPPLELPGVFGVDYVQVVDCLNEGEHGAMHTAEISHYHDRRDDVALYDGGAFSPRCKSFADWRDS